MRLLTEEEELVYSKLMDGIACSVFRESFASVQTLRGNNLDAKEHVQEVGMAMGQVVLDEVIESTKDMDRETLVKWFTEVSIAHVVSAMTNHPEYKVLIMTKLGLR